MEGEVSPWEAGRAAWPGVEVTESEFARYLDERNHSLKPDAAHVPAGGSVRTDDLYLACACARGDDAAIRVFERTFFDEIDNALKRRGGAAVPPVDEVRQLVRHKLFVASAAGRPKIADYTGLGTLRGWFRVTVMRMIMNLGMRAGPEVAFDDNALAGLLGNADDPELEFAKRKYTAEFRTAFGDAMNDLTPRERTLLRYAFVEGLTVDAIGALLRVHRATAARHVAAAHRVFVDRIRTTFVARLGISVDDLASVMNLIQSRLDLSLERYLETTSRGP